jgi:hypothetical protein
MLAYFLCIGIGVYCIQTEESIRVWFGIRKSSMLRPHVFGACSRCCVVSSCGRGLSIRLDRQDLTFTPLCSNRTSEVHIDYSHKLFRSYVLKCWAHDHIPALLTHSTSTKSTYPQPSLCGCGKAISLRVQLDRDSNATRTFLILTPGSPTIEYSIFSLHAFMVGKCNGKALPRTK